MESNIKHNLRSHNNQAKHPKLSGQQQQQHKKQEQEQDGANEDEEDPPHSISIDVPLIHHKNSALASSASAKLPVMSFSAISPVNIQDIQQTESILQVKRKGS